MTRSWTTIARAPGLEARLTAPVLLLLLALLSPACAAAPAGEGQVPPTGADHAGKPAPAGQTAPATQGQADPPIIDPGIDMTIEEAQEALTEPVMALDGVVGIAIGECAGVACIKVYLAAEDEDLEARIPDEFGGHPVRAEVTGEIRGPRPIG